MVWGATPRSWARRAGRGECAARVGRAVERPRRARATAGVGHGGGVLRRASAGLREGGENALGAPTHSWGPCEAQGGLTFAGNGGEDSDIGENEGQRCSGLRRDRNSG